MLLMENASVIDKPPHNLHQDLYNELNLNLNLNESNHLFEAKPERNSYSFEGSSDFNIINVQVKEKINFLIKIGLSLIKKCEIRTTKDSWSLKYDDNVGDDIIKILIKDQTLKYININNIVLKNTNMIEKINKFCIHYNHLSFRQSDDSIKFELYRILKKEIVTKYICFVGGEMVFYKALLNPIQYIMYTDYESIYKDSILNGNLYTYLINYETDKLKQIEHNYVLIANTSKSGLGKNLSKSITELDLNMLVIISCNKKSFQKDLLILKEKYSIVKRFELKTNYTVDVIFLYNNIKKLIF